MNAASANAHRDSGERARGPTRILMGVPAAAARGGGPALHLPMLVEDLRADTRFEVATFAYGRWRENEALLTKAAHQLVDLARYPFLLLHRAPDIVHLNTAFDRKAIARDVAFALLTRACGRRLMLKWHGSETHLLAEGPPLWRALARLLLACTDAVSVLSTDEKAALGRVGFVKPVWVVKNGLDLTRYGGHADVRPRLGLPPESTLLLFIARLIPPKGLEDAVEAMVLLDEPNAHLVVVGDGPTRVPAEARARARGVQTRVHFVGAVREDEALEFYRGSDILVLPTYHDEGFPMSIFQAVASGMAIVTTRIRAAADHLRDPTHCLFVPPRDPAALARALRRLLDSPELREEMARNNRELADRFDRRRVASEFAEIYTQLTRSHA